jgi:predicted XRE-type DNA-binding protein
MLLSKFLQTNEIKQADVATALEMDRAQMNRLLNPDANPTRQTVDSILLYLSDRLGRSVTYEEAFVDEGRDQEEGVA